MKRSPTYEAQPNLRSPATVAYPIKDSKDLLLLQNQYTERIWNTLTLLFTCSRFEIGSR